jgi:hypothetical protein
MNNIEKLYEKKLKFKSRLNTMKISDEKQTKRIEKCTSGKNRLKKINCRWKNSRM